MPEQYTFTFATYDKLPDLDEDDRLVVGELQKRGHRCQVAAWNDPHIDWRQGNAGTCVLRSTWEYYLQPQQFLRWARQVAQSTVLHNDLCFVESNWHKRYLVDFAREGLPVIPTVFLPAGSQANLAAVMEESGWTEAVIKPAIGAGTFGVKRVDRSPERLRPGQAHLDWLLSKDDVLIQKYMASVTTYGERALIFFNNEYSHALRKVPFHKLEEEGGHLGSEQPAAASAEELATAQRILNYVQHYVSPIAPDMATTPADCGKQPLYARVDLAPDENGQPLLMELELIEPSLFLSLAEGSAARFADAILKRL